MLYGTFQAGNATAMGRNSAVARSAGAERNRKTRPGGADELAGLKQVREQFIQRDAAQMTAAEMASGRHLLGFLQAYSIEPFTLTLFNKAMLCLYRDLAGREEGSMSISRGTMLAIIK